MSGEKVPPVSLVSYGSTQVSKRLARKLTLLRLGAGGQVSQELILGAVSLCYLTPT